VVIFPIVKVFYLKIFLIADIKRNDDNFIIPEKYFTAVCCFLTFNFFAMIGNLIPGIVQWVSKLVHA